MTDLARRAALPAEADLVVTADARAWAFMQRRAKIAPHGFRRVRQRELEEFTAELLRREIGMKRRAR